MTMKIRIKGNSLRYRLTKSDVSNFEEKGYLEEKTSFGNQTFIYALQRGGNNELTAEFQNNKITLFMPDTLIKEWVSTDRVGFRNTAGRLDLLVEKDFKCLDDVDEDQSDNYPNPRGN
ncbi:MAG: hypothetical protein NVSMB24_39500 [Mucilaginibacter sp.]